MKPFKPLTGSPVCSLRTSKRVYKDGSVPIQVRIRWCGLVKDFSLSIRCHYNQLDRETWTIKDDTHKTELLHRWKRDLMMSSNELTLQGIQPNPTKVFEIVLAKRGLLRYPNITESIEDEIKLAERKYNRGLVSRALVQQYNAYGKNIRSYLKAKHRLDLPFASLKPSDAYTFFDFVTIDLGFSAKYAIKNFGMLTRLTKNAYANGYIRTYIFEGVRFRNPRSKGISYLTENEIEAIEKQVFIEYGLQVVRDCFLFQCYTGFAYVDASMLIAEDIFTIDGSLCIRKERSKSGVSSFVPLLPQVISLIEKYRNVHPLGFLMPFISNQKMNEYLKTIAQKVGITRIKLTTHVARKSAATMLLNRGMTMTSVSRLLGHKNSKITGEIYAVVQEKTVLYEFRNMIEKFTNSKSA